VPSASANGITIEYDTWGNPSQPAIVLIMGLGAQMIVWDEEFVGALVDRGFHVIRFDNRDSGRSTWFEQAGVPDIVSAQLTGVIPKAPYTLVDMAEDAAALLASLRIEKCHVVGASMGGMIAQTLAIRHPQKVLSLVSIMSTTGDPAVGNPRGDVVAALFMSAPPTTREGCMDGAVESWKLIGSPGFSMHEDRIRAIAGLSFDRGVNPAGSARQIVAILSSPDRTSSLKDLTCPTLVIHGDADPLIDPSGGRATADAIPGAHLWLVPGMGHDIPLELFGEVADRIAANCRAA
jgi:pimeloyl-ACP methyl ester carboxylesterase